MQAFDALGDGPTFSKGAQHPRSSVRRYFENMENVGENSRSHTRVDGPLKVTGTATYAADRDLPHLAYAEVVTSTIARGHITDIDVSNARRVPGLLKILTYRELAPKIQPVKHLMAGGFVNSSALPLDSPEIRYAGQIVAVVVAESLEAAREAAFRVQVRYREISPVGNVDSPAAESMPLSALGSNHKDPTRGDAALEFGRSTCKIDETYRTPIQHHNPIELFGTTCQWQGDHLTVFEASRYIVGAQHGLAAQLGIPAEQIRFVCPFMGGHFGSRLALSQYTAPIAIAARIVNRPVRYVATRQQCFTVANHRPDTQHHIRIAATESGQFTSFLHEAEATSSRFDNFLMKGTDVTSSCYGWPNVETKESLVRVDRNTPGPMRAPPEVPYLFALESAVDELANKLKIDPIELRRKNDTQVDPISGKPFKPRMMMACFDRGAEAFGWTARDSKPRSMRHGDWLVGYGCASSVRPVKRSPATMRVALRADGKVVVESAHHEIGNGIYTVLAMEASRRLGVPIDAVTVRLGDTAFPAAGISGGSSTTTSLVPVLDIGCNQIRSQLAKALVSQDPRFRGRSEQEITMRDGFLRVPQGEAISLLEAFKLLGKSEIETIAEFSPEESGPDSIEKLRQGKMALGSPPKNLRWAYGAQFAEVHIHEMTGEIRVARLVGAFSAGRIMNRLTAMSQLKGGMIWGIGAALLEQSVLDPRSCRYVNDDLADYLVPTAADAGTVEAILLDPVEGDEDLMGLGELGIIGVNAAIANAVYHATGRRVRTLPIRCEDLL